MKRALVCAFLVALAVCPPASAHGGGGQLGLRSTVTRVTPSAPGLFVTVLGSGDRLELSNATGKTIVVLGYESEPYLAFRDGRVYRNARSPATYLNDDRFGEVTLPAEADATSPPEWEQVSDREVYDWHDHRIHWMSRALPPAVQAQRKTPRHIFDWSVPARIAGKPLTIRGSLDYAPSPRKLDWALDPAVLLAAGIAALLFAQAFVRLRRRGRRDHASWWRVPLFSLGLCVAVLPLVSPLDAVGDSYLLSGHMLEHVLIGDAAPALLLVALRGALLFFLVPAVVLRRIGRWSPLRASLGFLTRPRTALVAWALVYGLWHVPPAYDYVLTHQLAHDGEHATFFIAGALIWMLLIDPARTGRLRVGERLGVAALVFFMGMVLSDVLIFSFSSLYPSYAHQSTRLLGLSPVRDQQLAGLVMMSEQFVSLGICAALLIARSRHWRMPSRPRVAGARERTA